MLPKRVEDLLARALEIEEKDAKEAGALGFMARAMVQATLPHSDPKTNEFIRKNGNYTLTMQAPASVGLPYGTVPRLLLAWLCTEATKTQDRTLVLGDTLSSFMRELDMLPTGGRWGSISRLRNQMKRLFRCSIMCDYSDGNRDAGSKIDIVANWKLWWDPQQPEQAGLWQSTVTLGEAFYTELIAHPVPVDLRALRALRRSPMALDLYTWLTYRLSYLRSPTVIPWPMLQAQFGSNYGRERDFKSAFIEAMGKVHAVYPGAKIQPVERGLQLLPSSPSVRRLSSG